MESPLPDRVLRRSQPASSTARLFVNNNPHSHRIAARSALAAISFALACGGCNQGVHWQLGRYEDALKRGQREKKLTFVYFRSWYSVECTDFEEHVLKDAEVLAETNGMVCVPLDYDWDQPLAGRWGLKKVPAFALVGPDSEVLAKRQAPLSREDLLTDIKAARTALATRERERVTRAARPAASPPAQEASRGP